MTQPDSCAQQPQSAEELPRDGLSERLAAAERTVWRLTYVEFAWDIRKSLEFALLRTYAVPTISGLLARTGEFEHRTAKRYDDTALLIYEVMRNGLASERAQRAFGRINAMHGQFRIPGEDYLYVLSTFAFTPIDWLAAHGRRTMTEAERQDWFLYWNEFGRQMGIGGRLETYDAFRAFARNYERTHWVFAPSNRAIAERTIDLVLAMYYVPRALHAVARPLALAICEPELVAALGFSEPAPWLRRLAARVLGARRAVLAWLPAPAALRPNEIGRLTYPEGYNIEELGTHARTRPEKA